MEGDPQNNIQALLIRILDTAEKSELRIMREIQKHRDEFRNEIGPIYERVRLLEIEMGKTDERTTSTAARVGGLVALLTSVALLIASWTINHYPGAP